MQRSARNLKNFQDHLATMTGSLLFLSVAGLDYHVEVAKHYYSVPHAFLREELWARVTARTAERFHCGNRVAVHVRSSSNRKHTTVREHMPSSHRRYADWTPERIQSRANEIGPKTSALIEIILREKTHPEQGFRAGRDFV
jgi:transposase